MKTRHSHPSRRAMAARFAAIAAIVLASGCAGVATGPSPEAVSALAPGGKLRVGLYPGTPTSIIGDPSSRDAKGVGFDLGHALAQRAGVAFEPVVFPRNAEVLAAAMAGTVDMVFTNATPARSRDLDFSPTVLEVELGYLVPAAAAIRAIDDIDRPGVRVGVSEGSSSEAALKSAFRNATVVRTPSLQGAVEMMAAGKLDAFATNKATLHEMAEKLAGSRVLPGRWGLEHFAIGIPRGRDAALPYVGRFATDVTANGTVMRAVERAGLRGAIVP